MIDDNWDENESILNEKLIEKSNGAVLIDNGDNKFLNQNNISPILKRPHDDSFDISMMSTDSMIAGSAKKPKLFRTGSITKNLRRSISFAAIKTPINNIFLSRRSTVDTNNSMCSINSIESTFNDSIKKPMKTNFDKLKTNFQN